VEEAGASVGEALGVGGRNARRQGGVGRRRQGCWRERRREGEVGALADGGAARGIAGSGAHWRGRREAEEAWARCRAVRGRTAWDWDARGQESRGRLGGTRPDRWCGRGGRAGFGWSVGPLGPGDGSLVHQPRCE
jgi:hypothetical protein